MVVQRHKITYVKPIQQHQRGPPQNVLHATLRELFDTIAANEQVIRVQNPSLTAAAKEALFGANKTRWAELIYGCKST